MPITSNQNIDFHFTQKLNQGHRDIANMASNTEAQVAQPPWKLKATIYTFMMYISSKDAETLGSDKSFLYSPLEASSAFAKDRLVGGLAMVQVIRYIESPVGPYDEFLMAPGAFEYDVGAEQRNGKAETVKKNNMRVTRIYVSQKDTCWNGRTSKYIHSVESSMFTRLMSVPDWNIPKHLARFTFTNISGNAIAIAVYPHDTEGSLSESAPCPTPFFSAIYKPMPYLPSFPMSTGVAKYVGMDLSIVQPPLPEGKGSRDELPGTKQWCQCLPLEYSNKTSLGWWDLKQDEVSEEDALLGRDDDRVERATVGYENFWPSIGRWRVGLKMEDATIEFPGGKYWDGPKQ